MKDLTRKTGKKSARRSEKNQKPAESREKEERWRIAEMVRHMLRVQKKGRLEKSGRRKSRKTVTLAIAVGGSDDCVFMLYPEGTE